MRPIPAALRRASAAPIVRPARRACRAAIPRIGRPGQAPGLAHHNAVPATGPQLLTTATAPTMATVPIARRRTTAIGATPRLAPTTALRGVIPLLAAPVAAVVADTTVVVAAPTVGAVEDLTAAAIAKKFSDQPQGPLQPVRSGPYFSFFPFARRAPFATVAALPTTLSLAPCYT